MSTLNGYLVDGDAQTYKEKFRVSRETLDRLVALLLKTPLAGVTPVTPAYVLLKGPNGLKRRSRQTAAYAFAHRDVPTLRFKVTVCLYAMGKGGPLCVHADAASVGVSSVRRWLTQFCVSLL